MMDSLFGSAIILAGGKSERMGFDKQLLELGEKRLIDIQIEKLSEIFECIIVVTNTPELYDGKNVIVTRDVFPGKGPLAGIHAGLILSKSRYSFVIGCDMPNLSYEYISLLKNRIIDSNGKYPDVCLATTDGKWAEPFNGFYSKEIVGRLENHLKGERKSLNSFIDTVDHDFINKTELSGVVDYDWLFANLNTKEDLNSIIGLV